MPNGSTVEPPAQSPPRKPRHQFTPEQSRLGVLKRWANKHPDQPIAQLSSNPAHLPAQMPNKCPTPRTGEKTGQLAVMLARTEKPLAQEGDAVRKFLSKTLTKQMIALANKRGVKVEHLTGRDGLAQATKTLADAAATCYGWGEGSVPGLLLMGEVGRLESVLGDVPQVIDVQTVQPKPLGWEYDDPPGMVREQPVAEPQNPPV